MLLDDPPQPRHSDLHARLMMAYERYHMQGCGAWRVKEALSPADLR